MIGDVFGAAILQAGQREETGDAERLHDAFRAEKLGDEGGAMLLQARHQVQVGEHQNGMHRIGRQLPIQKRFDNLPVLHTGSSKAWYVHVLPPFEYINLQAIENKSPIIQPPHLPPLPSTARNFALSRSWQYILEAWFM